MAWRVYGPYRWPSLCTKYSTYTQLARNLAEIAMRFTYNHTFVLELRRFNIIRMGEAVHFKFEGNKKPHKMQ